MILREHVRWSASELVDAFTCAHRVRLERRVRAGGLERPAPSGEAAIVARRGLEHEAAVFARLAQAGIEINTIERPFGSAEYAIAAMATQAALARGDAAIANATFLGPVDGVVDLLRRVDGRSIFGSWSYEVVDVRLGARSEPAAVLQACAYVEALAAALGVAFDEQSFRVVLGDGRERRFAVAPFAAYYRAFRDRMLVVRDAGAPTFPDKLAACARCRWNERCTADRISADDVGLVANIRRDQVAALRAAGLGTVAALGAAAPAPEARPDGITAPAWERLRDQASLQAAADRDGVHRYRLLPPETRAGFALLPPASPGDLYFDMEGDPFYPGGLEYLFGLGWVEAGEPRFRPVWAHQPADQLAAVEALLATIRERRAADPAMHVYHYAPYERTALARLTDGTPLAAELDALARAEVFVDLYAVVRGALRVSTPSYSIKSLELFYRGRKRATAVSDALGSVVAYEEYLRSGDTDLLDQIAIYNRDDVDSTRELHHWLLERKAEAEARFGPPVAVDETERTPPSEDAELAGLCSSLAAGTRPDVLLADLLEYHRREARPQWREYFARLRSEPAALIDDPKCLGGLVPVAGVAPVAVKQSTAYTLAFPPQAHGFEAGDTAADPATGRSAGEIVEVTGFPDGGGRIVLKRGKRLETTALPRALVPNDFPRLTEIEESLRRLARTVAAGGDGGLGHAILARALPMRRSGVPVDGDAAVGPAELAGLIDDLDRSALVVQGPPGTGKTWTAARAIVALLARGRRIGVAAATHKAVNTLLAEVERVANERGVRLAGWKKSDSERPETCYGGAAIRDVDDAKAFPPGADVNLIAGTPSLWARAALERSVDVLVVDEAGQVALADAVAIAGAAPALVLCGDPRQLPNVAAGAHPAGADVSVLEHLLDGAATVPPERGVFLPRSYRLHPEIAAFVSDLMYDGRLTGAEECARRRIVLPGDALDGAGLRTLAVAHRGRTTAAPEEADAIVALLGRLSAARVVEADGSERAFRPADLIVVAPYNAQVALVRERLERSGFGTVRVGTVDKFQGQEATVVCYTMTCSSGEDVPRDLDFLLDRNRLNVAISRARTLAVLVHGAELPALIPRTIEQLELAGALARFIERADRLTI
jgi:uncharacterized protein